MLGQVKDQSCRQLILQNLDLGLSKFSTCVAEFSNTVFHLQYFALTKPIFNFVL